MDTETDVTSGEFDELVEEQGERGRRRWVWVVGGLLVLMLLAGAAFVGGRILNNRNAQAAGGDNGIMLSSKGPGGTVSKSIKVQGAEELPDRKADESGIFVRREDNSLYIGTGKVTMMFKKGGGVGFSSTDGESSTNYDGPVVEVVVTNQTVVYKDTTNMNLGQTSGEEEVQQTVAPGSLDEIGQESMISVWGRKSGDRLIADVLVYSSPVVMAKPGK